MTKEVLISITGLHFDIAGGGSDPIEVITPASYYEKNGKHYVVYDEVVEGMPGSIKNTIKITGDEKFEIVKNGHARTHMIFEKEKMNITNYQTPYGDMMIGIYTKDIKMEEEEKKIGVQIRYVLDVNNEPLAECQIQVTVRNSGQIDRLPAS